MLYTQKVHKLFFVPQTFEGKNESVIPYYELIGTIGRIMFRENVLSCDCRLLLSYLFIY